MPAERVLGAADELIDHELIEARRHDGKSTRWRCEASLIDHAKPSGMGIRLDQVDCTSGCQALARNIGTK